MGMGSTGMATMISVDFPSTILTYPKDDFVLSTIYYFELYFHGEIVHLLCEYEYMHTRVNPSPPTLS